MKTVGVRQLKENLSRYLNRVKSGERIIVTDRKKEVAVIIPYGMEKDEEKVLRLIQRGVAYKLIFKQRAQNQSFWRHSNG